MDNIQVPLENANQSGAVRIVLRHASGEIVIPQEMSLEKIEGEVWIKYRFPVAGKTRKTSGALMDFLRLADEPFSEERAYAFAQKWGVLCFCGHNLIASHNTKCFPICDEPLYSDIVAFVEEGAKDDIEAMKVKMIAATHNVWFREPMKLWFQYASRMRAILRIAFSLRGDWRGNTLPDWEIIRGIGGSTDYGRMIQPVQGYESFFHAPIHQAPLAQKFHIIGNILSMWMGEAYFIPHIEWLAPDTTSSSQGLIAQTILNASYADVVLFPSDCLTLFSVLVAQCITALGPNRFVGQCACFQCSAHEGPCQRFTETRQGRGRPLSYCETCGPHIRQQQKSASRRRNRSI